jgi:hypothetical protein
VVEVLDLGRERGGVGDDVVLEVDRQVDEFSGHGILLSSFQTFERKGRKDDAKDAEERQNCSRGALGRDASCGRTCLLQENSFQLFFALFANPLRPLRSTAFFYFQ